MNLPPSTCPSCSAPLRIADEACPFCGFSLAAGSGRDQGPPPPPPAAVPPVEGESLASPREFDERGRRSQAPGIGRGPEKPREVSDAGTTSPAWERRREVGFFAALWLTWRDSVFRPVPFFRRLPPRAGYGSPLGYTVLVTVFGTFFSFYWGTIEEAVGGTLERGLVVELVSGFVTLVIGLALAIPLYLALLFASVGIIHVGLVIVGAGRRGYEATFRAVAYASGPAALAVFPFFGPLLGLVWGMVLIYLAVREVQRTTNGRVTLGFLLPFLAFLAFLILVGLLLAVALRSLGVEPAA